MFCQNGVKLSAKLPKRRWATDRKQNILPNRIKEGARPMFATVRDYLVQYPDMGLNILMPMGFVQIPPRMGRELLSQGGERIRFKVAGTGAAITAGDLLKQRICRVSSVRGDYWRVFLVTELASAISKDRNSTGLTFEQTTFLNE